MNNRSVFRSIWKQVNRRGPLQTEAAFRLFIVALCLLGTSSAPGLGSLLADEKKAETASDSETQNTGRSMAEREQKARQPYNYIQLSYMSVPEGGEDDYLAIETEWKEIHEARCQLGDVLFWGLLKVDKPDAMGCQYVTIQGFHSLDDSRKWPRFRRVAKVLGKEIDVDALIERTKASREILYSETYEMVDYVGSSSPDVDIARFGFFQPGEGLEQEYVDAETNEAKPRWQTVVDVNPAFKMWGLTRLVSTTADTRSHKYRIFHLLDSKHLAKTDEERQQLKEKIRAAAPKATEQQSDTDWNKLRKFVKGGQLHWVMRTSKESNPVAAEWEKLTGAWKAQHANGGYRIKRIEPFQETLEWYSEEGELKGTATMPMRIEVRDGVNHFFSYHAKGTFHSTYKVHEGKWYEQLRGIYRDSQTAPDRFLVYDRIEDDAAGETSEEE